MKLQHHPLMLLPLLLLTHCRSAPVDSQLKDASMAAAAGYFACDGDNSNCHLIKQLVAKDSGISAQYQLTYSFTCTIGGEGLTSKIALKVGVATQLLAYGAKSLAVDNLIGTGDLTLVDTDPTFTAAYNFDAPCDLSFNYLVIPSAEQEISWGKDAALLALRLSDNTEIYRSRMEVQSWYDVYIASPTPGVKAVLQQQIASLQASGRTLDKLKARALQNIIDGIGKDVLFAPYATARDRILETMPKAKTLLAVIAQWNANVDAGLTSAVNTAGTALAE